MRIEIYNELLKNTNTYLKNKGYVVHAKKDYFAEYTNGSEWNIIISAEPRDDFAELAIKHNYDKKIFLIWCLETILHELLNIPRPKPKNLIDQIRYLFDNKDVIFDHTEKYESEYNRVFNSTYSSPLDGGTKINFNI